MLLWPFAWRRGASVERLRGMISNDLGGDVTLFASGREGLLALMKALEIGNGDEVIIQAYTCVVVPNAIHAAGALPIYADIESETLNLDPESVEKLITPNTCAVICQHTFGIPAPLSELKEICDRHHLTLIEDCAHVIPDAKGPAGVAKTGDYALLSFGRDKAISGVSGGAIVSRHPQTALRLKVIEGNAHDLSPIAILRYILYPIIYSIAKPFYGLGLGKIFLYACAKLTLFSPIVTSDEKHGRQSPTLHRLPNTCAFLAVDQWKKLSRINDHRRALVSIYSRALRERGVSLIAGACEGLPLQKFPLFLTGAEGIRRSLKKHNIHLHDGWTGCVVCPPNVDQSMTGYDRGSDRHAELACEQILSLPTHPDTPISEVKKLLRNLPMVTSAR